MCSKCGYPYQSCQCECDEWIKDNEEDERESEDPSELKGFDFEVQIVSSVFKSFWDEYEKAVIEEMNSEAKIQEK